MNITFTIHPRQTGKTSKAIYEFIKNNDSIFIAHNNQMREHIRNYYNLSNDKIKNIFIGDTFTLNNSIRINTNNVIIDEYYFINKQDVLFERIKHNIRPENVYVFTSARVQFRKHIFDFVKEYKQSNQKYNIYWLYEQYYGKPDEFIKKEIDDLYNDFITEPNSKLIDNGYMATLKFYGHKDVLRKEEIELELHNKYLKEFKIEDND